MEFFKNNFGFMKYMLKEVDLVPEEEAHYFYSWFCWVFEKCHKLLKDAILVIFPRIVFDISRDFSRGPFRVA